jgi:hypothetical protein
LGKSLLRLPLHKAFNSQRPGIELGVPRQLGCPVSDRFRFVAVARRTTLLSRGNSHSVPLAKEILAQFEEAYALQVAARNRLRRELAAVDRLLVRVHLNEGGCGAAKPIERVVSTVVVDPGRYALLIDAVKRI